jgi:hypothetical protein
MGIAVHSTQSVILIGLVLTLVLDSKARLRPCATRSTGSSPSSRTRTLLLSMQSRSRGVN